jgi:hypothetical protein
VGEIARRAGGDDPSDPSEDEDEMSPEDRAEYIKKRAHQKAEREKTAKMMDLQYFLEMVDQKHRYGSNLRAYHDHWKKTETNENFFYWLDYGAGKYFEHPTVSRERLEKEQVRYLTREERMKYLVVIDQEGRLCWAKNGERISTSMEYKDSVNGIVPKDDETPAYASGGRLKKGSRRPSDVSSSSSDSSEHSDVEGEHYVNHDLDKSKGLSKIKHVSAATVLNHLLRSSVKPNSWIFVSTAIHAFFNETNHRTGRRHFVSTLYRHQAIWRLPAQFIPPRRSHIIGWSYKNQRRTATPPLAPLWPLSTAYEEFPLLCTLPTRQWS